MSWTEEQVDELIQNVRRDFAMLKHCTPVQIAKLLRKNIAA